MTQKGKDRKKSYQWELKEQWRGKPLSGYLHAEIYLYFGDKRKRDFDNFHKILMDSLEGVVLEDDSQIWSAYIQKCYSKENPRAEIVLRELKDD